MMAQGPGGKAQPTKSSPQQTQGGNASSTGAQGNPPATNPITGTPNPQRTGAGEGRVRRGFGPATP